MYKVLIVEDEVVLRRWLVNCMDWTALGFAVAGEAENGLDALRIIKSMPVDAVLTDIRMADMDGLELMEMLRGFSSIPVVILSGYNSFAYARRALQLDAYEFLTKPLDQSELDATFMRLREHLDKHLDSALSQTATINPTFHQIPEGVFTGLLLPETVRSVLERLPVPIEQEFMAVADLQWNAVLSAETVMASIQRAAGDRKCAAAIVDMGGHAALLLGGRRDSCQADYADELSQLLKTSTVICGQAGYGETVFTAQLSVPLNRVEAIPAAYDAVCREIASAFFSGYGTIRLSSGKSNRAVQNVKQLLMEQTNAVKDAAARVDREDTLHHFTQLSGLIDSIAGADVIEVKFLLLELLLGIEMRFHDRGIQLEGMASKTALFQAVFTEPSWQSLRQYVRSLLLEIICQAVAARQQLASAQTISGRATQYIAEHIREKLLLEDIASALFISPAYLSTCFKRETGVSMVSMINRMKIDRAKTCLCDQDLSVQEVSDWLGFANYRYFCTMFKTETGVSPSVYRKTIRQGGGEDQTDPSRRNN